MYHQQVFYKLTEDNLVDHLYLLKITVPNTEIKNKKRKIVSFRKLTVKYYCFLSVWQAISN